MGNEGPPGHCQAMRVSCDSASHRDEEARWGRKERMVKGERKGRRKVGGKKGKKEGTVGRRWHG